jgi:hypothetical protein
MGSPTTLPSYCLQDLCFPQLSDHVAVLLEQQQRLYQDLLEDEAETSTL